jgi:hypothetical protein
LAALVERRIERRLLPEVVHELTHHWSFASPVGEALTLLRLETLAGVLASGAQTSGAELRRLLDPLARYQHAAFGLRPVAEAMALFAEFDATPGGSEVTALPLWLATYLLARHRELLVGMNWTRPYATGYAALQGWWERLRAQSVAAADSEVFLCFMRRWFYEDLELVDLLLGEHEPGVDPRPAVEEHLDRRFRFLSDRSEGVVVHGDLPAGVLDQARAGTFDPHHLREILRAVNGIVEEEVLRGRPWSPAWSRDREHAQHAANYRAFKHAVAAIAATQDAQRALLDGGLHRVLGPAAHRLLVQAAHRALEGTGPDADLLAKVRAAGESAGVALTGPNGLRV